MRQQTAFAPKTEKRPGGIEGRGLCATAPMAQGESVVVKGGDVMTTAQRHTIAETLGPAALQIADDLPLGPTTPAEGGRHDAPASGL